MKRLWSIILCLWIGSCIYASEQDSLLRVLDKELTVSDYYLSLRVVQIEHLRAISPFTASVAFQVAEKYSCYQCDSALKYYNLAIALCTDSIPIAYMDGYRQCQNRMYGENSSYVWQYPHDVQPPMNTHEYAIYCYERSESCHTNNDDVGRALWLTRSAITDVRLGITDNASSWMLAEMLYNAGDVKRAYKYVRYSLNNAILFNARMRYAPISKLELIINSAYEVEQQERTLWLIGVLCSIGILFISLIIGVIYIHRKNRQLKRLTDVLREESTIKEQYLCSYMEVYSENIRQMSKMSQKTLGINASVFLEERMTEFYHRFDTTFLTLYPHFVTDFNALLQSDKRIILSKGKLLNTELRIFALIRLGIESSTKIAELLCYSISTIYTYRTKIRGYALGEKNTFEEKVKKL